MKACLIGLLFGASLATCGWAAETTIQLPGAPPFDKALQATLLKAWNTESAKSRQTTEHGNPSPPKYINRLILSSSPYLQQHALNPVNWYPWGNDAFEAAKREAKPIFLSIGYSS